MSDKKQKDFTTHWIFAYYEDGMAVSQIACCLAIVVTERCVTSGEGACC